MNVATLLFLASVALAYRLGLWVNESKWEALLEQMEPTAPPQTVSVSQEDYVLLLQCAQRDADRCWTSGEHVHRRKVEGLLARHQAKGETNANH